MATDPFNIVREELKRTINKTKSLIESYDAIASNGKNADDSNETLDKIRGDIRTNLKSIDWDVQDLEETIKIASKNPSRFNLTSVEIQNRNGFIDQTREFIQTTKKTYNINLNETNGQQGNKKIDPNSISIRVPDIISNTDKNSKFAVNDDDQSEDELFSRKAGNANSRSAKNQQANNSNQMQIQHTEMFKEQDRNLELISDRVSTLKNIGHAMQNELDDQANLIDDMGRELDTADSRMNNVMKRITKILHLSSDGRQWTVIGVLLLGILILLILFAIL